MVLLIISMLAGIAFQLDFQERSSRVLDAATITAISTLREAQMQAIAGGSDVRVILATDLEGDLHGFQFLRGSSGTPFESIPLSEEVRFDDSVSGNQVVFDGLGTPTPDSNLPTVNTAPNPYYLDLDSWDGSETRRITIQSATGQVRVE